MLCEQVTVDTMDVRSQDQRIMENAVQAAEQLLHSLLSSKRRLSSVDVIADPSARSYTPPKKKTRTQQKKEVRFAEDKRVHVIKTTEDDDFPNRRWYQEHDYKRIKQENAATLIAISKANGKITTIDATAHCVRGLEVQISVLVLQMPYGNRQKKVVRSVLSLQQIQRKMQIQDAIALREMSLIISKQDKLKAWKIATIDAY